MRFKWNKEKAAKLIKVLKTGASVLWWLIVAGIAVMMFSIIGAKIRGRVPSVFGYSVMNIISGSMGEEMPTGSYILVKRIDAEKIKENDIICFYSDDPAIYGIPNTHRVVAPPIRTESGMEFVTKGDESADNDAVTAKGDRLVGIYVKRLYGLERLADALDGGVMMVIIIVMQAAVIAMLVVSVIKSRHEGESNTDPEDSSETVGKKK